ncbi:hypothetical protein V5O48_014679 [Marasmius crinis-equi]|uniref:Uncharacterized protein n=1 Tax=Marasmius crinis-equi TaxID=585013 RepID=A0ABR3EWM6_9AGAR
MSQSVVDDVLEGLVPDFILQRVIRALLRQHLHKINHGTFQANHTAKMDWVARVKARSFVADLTEKANEQHYEVPTGIGFVLGVFVLFVPDGERDVGGGGGVDYQKLLMGRSISVLGSGRQNTVNSRLEHGLNMDMTLTYFQEDLTLIKNRYLSGVNHSWSLEDWLRIQDSDKTAGRQELREDVVKKGIDAVEAAKTFYNGA